MSSQPEFLGFPKPPRPPEPGVKAWIVTVRIVCEVTEYADCATDASAQAENFINKLFGYRNDLQDVRVLGLLPVPKQTDKEEGAS